MIFSNSPPPLPPSYGRTIIKCALALGLVNLLISVGSLEAALDAEALFYLRLRPRLGHLPGVDGYLGIYQDYFDNTIKLNDKRLAGIDINDWRNVRPTGELCVEFLQSFQIKKYKLAKPYAIIALDACLGWLFDKSDEKQEDVERFTVATRLEVDKIAKDKTLEAIYQSTAFKEDKVPKKTKEELHEYLLKLLKVYSDNPRSGCHGLWLETYTDFMEDVYLGDCDSDQDCLYFGYEGALEDSYLKLIAESTKRSSITCYGVMQKQIKGIMRQAYETEMAVSAKLSKRIKAATSARVDKQSEVMMWGKDMIRILQLVSGTDQDQPINLVQVVKDLNKLRINDEDTVERFTEAVGNYAIQNVNLKESADDPEGRARFGKAVTKLCKPYINPHLFLAQTGGSTLWQEPNDNKNPFEFYNIVYGLIRLTNHEFIYGISKDKFEEDVLKFKWESLYLTTFACQLISITWGELNYDSNEEAYSVSFRSNDGEDLIEDWPLHVMLSKVVDDTSKDFKQLPEPQPLPVEQPAEQQAQTQQEPQFEPPSQPQQPQPQKQQHQQKQPKQQQVETTVLRSPSSKKDHSYFPSFKFKMFSKSKHGHQHKSNEQPSTDGPEPATPELKQDLGPASKSQPSKPPQVMSLESIEMFRDIHGRYPKLPANIHEIYPSLPKNLDDVYPKKMGLNKQKPQVKPEPQQPKPHSGVGGGYNSYGGNSYGSNSYGGNSYGGNSYGSNSYGSNSYGSNSYGSNSYGSNSYGGNSFGGPSNFGAKQDNNNYNAKSAPNQATQKVNFVF